PAAGPFRAGLARPDARHDPARRGRPRLPVPHPPHRRGAHGRGARAGAPGAQPPQVPGLLLRAASLRGPRRMKPSAMSRHLLRTPLLACLLLLSACYQPGRFVWVDDYREPQTQVQGDENYLIRKGDVLNVNVWNQRDISSRIRVRDDGRISLP